jgi:outer membrane protein OmpA-like peptidoglycan-associated protein/opacity protein-like surface antigen
MLRTKRPFPLSIVVAASMLFLPSLAMAQIEGFHVTVTPYGGWSIWDSKTNFWDKPLAGGTFVLMFGPVFGLEGDFAYILAATNNGPTPYASGATGLETVDAKLYHAGADLQANLIPNGTFDPYLLAGYHWLRFSSDVTTQPEETFSGFEGGAGVKVRVAPRVSLRFEGRDILFSFDSPPAPDNSTTHNFLLSAGVEFAIGGHEKDSDKDGVPDKKDECPETPLKARVDAHGCPIDGDQDGVYDGIDTCPGTPVGATVDATGCPHDSDKDGVLDGLDKCPDTPSGVVVDLAGCPLDTDKDGVPDGIDQCANTPTGATVDSLGCPEDSDKDGVPDGIDKCPNTPVTARVDKDGCPIEISEKEVELLDTGKITVRNIHFETGKWDILPDSYTKLDEIGQVLIQWPELRIEVGGHADARGSDAFNLALSEKRANAVLQYILGKFPQINASQYTAKGYGESQPVATNKTAEGMALNRRVEFKVLNTEVLKKEYERRKTLQRP